MVTRSRRISSAAVSTVAFGLLALLGTGCASSNAPGPAPSSAVPSSSAPPGAASSLAPVNGTYSPSIDPANFVATIDNPYWPLKPGTTYHYEGVRGTTPQTDDEVVTHETKLILGVTCTVVKDTVSEHGAPVERTFDWYAQDKHGNVWYMGEDSLELKNGRFVRASDSWQAGVNGAKPGIIIEGHPKAGDVYRQEYYRPGGALDQARVLRERPTVVVPS